MYYPKYPKLVNGRRFTLMNYPKYPKLVNGRESGDSH